MNYIIEYDEIIKYVKCDACIKYKTEMEASSLPYKEYLDLFKG